jgi:predicted regulator of Ras-like GTPase activity (Roadblock/LC7/MglB family)
MLSRICGNGIQAALLVTTDGELLGTSSPLDETLEKSICETGSLITEIAADYQRLGHELDSPTLKFLLLELELITVAVCSAGKDCLVICMADPTTPHGMIKARLRALASHVKEALTPLTEPT